MINEFPNDADGDALRKIAEYGADLSKKMLIDFQISMPNETTAIAFSKIARELGYHVQTFEINGCKLPWTCECSTRMIASYENVIAIQKELAEIAIPYGGCLDGWGTFGNRTLDNPSL